MSDRSPSREDAGNPPAAADVTVVHDAAADRFTVAVGADVAELIYQRSPGEIEFLHTEVPESLRGHGVAEALARAGLEFARASGLAVVAKCPFVAAFIGRNREYQPLLAED